jgi:hypothetical protein
MRSEVVSLFATEKLPSPYVVVAVVVNDLPSRSLGVRLSETASGCERSWWKQAWQQLKAGWEDGWRNHPHVRASAPGTGDVGIVHPADFQMLQVSFPSGVAAYSGLISRPGLVAFVSVDRSTGRFMGVKFKHMP